jgi:hypothetical protein
MIEMARDDARLKPSSAGKLFHGKQHRDGIGATRNSDYDWLACTRQFQLFPAAEKFSGKQAKPTGRLVGRQCFFCVAIGHRKKAGGRRNY